MTLPLNRNACSLRCRWASHSRTSPRSVPVANRSGRAPEKVAQLTWPRWPCVTTRSRPSPSETPAGGTPALPPRPVSPVGRSTCASQTSQRRVPSAAFHWPRGPEMKSSAEMGAGGSPAGAGSWRKSAPTPEIRAPSFSGVAAPERSKSRTRPSPPAVTSATRASALFTCSFMQPTPRPPAGPGCTATVRATRRSRQRYTSPDGRPVATRPSGRNAAQFTSCGAAAPHCGPCGAHRPLRPRQNRTCFAPKVTNSSSRPPGVQFHSTPQTSPGVPWTLPHRLSRRWSRQLHTYTVWWLSATTVASLSPNRLKPTARTARSPASCGIRARSDPSAGSHTQAYGVWPICPLAARSRPSFCARHVTSSSWPMKKVWAVRACFFPAVRARTHRAAHGNITAPALERLTLCRWTRPLYP